MSLDFFEYADALDRRDASMAIVTAHAEENHPGWKDQAGEFVRRYAALYREFISEDCTDWAYAHGLSKPHDPRAFGQIYRDSAKAGVIRKAGYGHSVKRASPTVLWRSCHTNFEV